MEIVLRSIPDFSLTQTGIVLSISSSEYLTSLTLLAKVYSTIWDWLRLEQFNQSYATKEEYLPGYWPKSRALHLYQKTKYKKLLNSLPIIPSSFIQQSKTHARLAKKPVLPTVQLQDRAHQAKPSFLSVLSCLFLWHTKVSQFWRRTRFFSLLRHQFPWQSKLSGTTWLDLYETNKWLACKGEHEKYDIPLYFVCSLMRMTVLSSSCTYANQRPEARDFRQEIS